MSEAFRPPDPRQPDSHAFVERPHATLVWLSLPVLVSLVAEPLTGLVDTAFVARLGASELAALGVATTLLSSVLWIFNFLGIGTQTEVAAALGRGDARGSQVAVLAMAIGGVAGILLAAAIWPLAEAAARVMGAQGDAVHGAATYLRIRLLGGPAVLITVAAFGALRGVQDMRSPLWIALGANAVNVALDALLIFGVGPFPRLGLAGAAWASSISQWLGVGFALLAVVRRLGWPSRVEWHGAGSLLVVGRDLVLRTGSLLLFIALTTRAANRIGTDAGAAHQAIRQVWTFTAFLLDAWAHAAQSLVGFFLAAARVSLARRVAAVAAMWSLGTGIALCALMFATTLPVAVAFVPESARSLFYSAWWLAAVTQPLNGLSFVTDGIHWGTSDYPFLRNVMACATLGGAALLFGLEASGRLSLAGVWAVMGAWIGARALFGMLRVWPGIGASPLRADAR